MKNKNKTIAIVVIPTILLAIGAYFVLVSPTSFSKSGGNESRKRETPTSVTMNFLNEWLTQRKSTTTNPFSSGLLNSDVISDEVRAQIERSQLNRKTGDIDPVLCQPSIPNRIDGDELFSRNNRAVVVVKPRDKNIKTEHQALVSLRLINERWIITKLDCTVGEQGPENEFHFEKVGFLLRDSLQAPYNNQSWHLVYEEEMEPGFVMPLSFNQETVCIQKDNTTTTCNVEAFTETTKVFIQADMTETGAIVKRMTFE